MIKWLSIFLHTFVSLLRARRDLAFENLLLRQQLAVLNGRGERPRLTEAVWLDKSPKYVVRDRFNLRAVE